MAHIFAETGILSAFIGGVSFAYIYLKTDNIYSSVIAHLLYNVTTYLLSPYIANNYAIINEYPLTISILFSGAALIYVMGRVLNQEVKSKIEIAPEDNKDGNRCPNRSFSKIGFIQNSL